MTTTTDDDRIASRAREIGARESERLLERTPRSAALYQRATQSLPAGVTSNFQAHDPYPVYLDHGLGECEFPREELVLGRLGRLYVLGPEVSLPADDVLCLFG